MYALKLSHVRLNDGMKCVKANSVIDGIMAVGLAWRPST